MLLAVYSYPIIYRRQFFPHVKIFLHQKAVIKIMCMFVTVLQTRHMKTDMYGLCFSLRIHFDDFASVM